MKTFIKFFLASTLMLWSIGAGAQSFERSKDRFIGSSGKAELEKMLTPRRAEESGVPSNYKSYTDNTLQDLERQMKEREWGSEDTAWNRACEINSSQAYERYMAIYPTGAHIADASRKLVDARVAETLNNAHNELPDIMRVEPDDDSPTSTILIKNNTGLTLTVYYSGSVSKSLVIPPDGMNFITLENGPYKLAATVPPAHIKPYAGKTELRGGRYEIGFWIVTR